MQSINILVVDDEIRWQDALREILSHIERVNIDTVSDYASAMRSVKNRKYELAVVDLSLGGNVHHSGEIDLAGMQLMRELRTSRHNKRCGLIVLTGYPNSSRTKAALREYDAFDFISKDDFDNRNFLKIARAAILDARLKQAMNNVKTCYRLTVTVNSQHITGCTLTGPDRRSDHVVKYPQVLDFPDLVRRADMLNFLILSGVPELWRQEAKSVGDAVFKLFSDEQQILKELGSAQALSDQSSDLWLEFNSPAAGLGIPFELLREDQTYFCLKHILTRRLQANLSRKLDPFYALISHLKEHQETLRLLIVGANSDGRIPSAEVEAEELASKIKVDLQTLGLEYELNLLLGENATYQHVKEALRYGGYHIFHYAGHGRFDDSLPEISGLILLDDSKPHILSAAELSNLTKDTDLQFVFLSCCLGARAANQVGRGDFYGTLEALMQADIPTVLGYRWTVSDTSARSLAKAFYESLWQTFLPGKSLLEARCAVAAGTLGRDDETWLSPVLMTQNI